MQPQRFTAVVSAAPRGGAFVPVPFDPDRVWRPKPLHHITGTVNGMGVRAVIEVQDGRRGFTLGPAWLRDCRAVGVGDTVAVEVMPEGPQRDDLADDVAAALDASPEAGAFFDSLAQFYRRAYLRWVDATKRRPDLRAQRIAEMVRLLDAGIKQRPRPKRRPGPCPPASCRRRPAPAGWCVDRWGAQAVAAAGEPGVFSGGVWATSAPGEGGQQERGGAGAGDGEAEDGGQRGGGRGGGQVGGPLVVAGARRAVVTELRRFLSGERRRGGHGATAATRPASEARRVTSEAGSVTSGDIGGNPLNGGGRHR